MIPVFFPYYPAICSLSTFRYGRYNRLFKVDRDPVPLIQALCWAHVRRKFFMLADIATLIKAAKLNDVDPQAWLADVLARIAEIPSPSWSNCSCGIGSPPNP